VRRSQITGVLLYCGPYILDGIDFHGPFGSFLRTVLWSYSGSKGFLTNPRFAAVAVMNYVSAEFPPAFISAGNGDPLLSQSVAFADALSGRGVHVDRLFFPADYQPPAPHEYQFDLGNDAGKVALERSLQFLSERR
jgi:acetyl esterase/lipase